MAIKFYNTPYYEETEHYYEYLKNYYKKQIDENTHKYEKNIVKNKDYLASYTTIINRINEYSERFNKHISDFNHIEIMAFLTEGAKSSSKIGINIRGVNAFIIYLNSFLGKNCKLDFQEYKEAALNVWSNAGLVKDVPINRIITLSTLEKIIEELFEVYPFYQRSVFLLLVWHGLTYKEIDDLKFSQISDDNIITLDNRIIYMNDTLVRYMKESIKQTEFIVPNAIKNARQEIRKNELVMSGLANKRARVKNKDNDFKCYKDFMHLLYRCQKDNKYQPILKTLSYSGMLNSFVYNKLEATELSIKEHLVMFNIIPRNIRESSLYTHIKDFKSIYYKYIDKFNEDISFANIEMISNEIMTGRMEKDNELENTFFNIDINGTTISRNDSKHKESSEKYASKILVGNQSEEFVKAQYENSYYVDDFNGFDIYDPSKNICIEVKTVNKHNEFEISINELQTAILLKERYLLYLVKYSKGNPYEFKKIYDPIKYFNIVGDFITRACKNDRCILEPSSFMIKI